MKQIDIELGCHEGDTYFSLTVRRSCQMVVIVVVVIVAVADDVVVVVVFVRLLKLTHAARPV